ncbi:hypothetical protein J0895_09820 [Phormidium pseudopriestleyi FRX01]|uniref:Uncharacterized protein n=1 Tax=Phormidium pseudopriestleyi FRX01 TaxID=1759528 RepID=A0ABS3FRB6_9CYAN|nr:hypothetical protein [Phormidium pseudopriestleyi]MBO0349397.1 hypothetical protein [Phormidium pseudopriestleyi FRX01]
MAESYLRDAVAPNATILDRDTDALKTALQGLGSRHLVFSGVTLASAGD